MKNKNSNPAVETKRREIAIDAISNAIRPAGQAAIHAFIDADGDDVTSEAASAAVYFAVSAAIDGATETPEVERRTA